jgi:hypothetical protein
MANDRDIPWRGKTHIPNACSHCNGYGKILGKTCPQCHGSLQAAPVGEQIPEDQWPKGCKYCEQDPCLCGRPQ